MLMFIESNIVGMPMIDRKVFVGKKSYCYNHAVKNEIQRPIYGDSG